MRPEPDLSKRCWCSLPGGCSVSLNAGPAGRLCPICKTAGHKAMSKAKVARLIAKRKAAT